jgi:hypothetical protein
VNRISTPRTSPRGSCELLRCGPQPARNPRSPGSRRRTLPAVDVRNQLLEARCIDPGAPASSMNSGGVEPSASRAITLRPGRFQLLHTGQFVAALGEVQHHGVAIGAVGRQLRQERRDADSRSHQQDWLPGVVRQQEVSTDCGRGKTVPGLKREQCLLCCGQGRGRAHTESHFGRARRRW